MCMCVRIKTLMEDTRTVIIIIIIKSNHTPAGGAKGEGIGEGNKDRHPIHTTNQKVHI